jgi:HAE1 family hydrophobic/amphiphilic exporter-1
MDGVGRTSEVTQIDMANAVREEVVTIRQENLVENFDLNEMVAQADYVSESINGVSKNIIIGSIIARQELKIFEFRDIRSNSIINRLNYKYD